MRMKYKLFTIIRPINKECVPTVRPARVTILSNTQKHSSLNSNTAKASVTDSALIVFYGEILVSSPLTLAVDLCSFFCLFFFKEKKKFFFFFYMYSLLKTGFVQEEHSSKLEIQEFVVNCSLVSYSLWQFSCCWSLLYSCWSLLSAILRSRAYSLRSKSVDLSSSFCWFIFLLFRVHRSGVLTVLFACYMAGATWNCCGSDGAWGCDRVYTTTRVPARPCGTHRLSHTPALMLLADHAQGTRPNRARADVMPSEVRSCVKVEVAVLGSPSLTFRTVSVDVKRHWTWTSWQVWHSL